MEQIQIWNSNTNKVEIKKDDSEKLRLKQEEKEKIKAETKEALSNEKLIQDTKLALYDKLWINFELAENTDIKKFVKWFVDGLIINNIEAVKQIIEMWIEKFVESLKELLSISGILEFLKSLKDEISNLTDILQKPYEWWVIIWWYGLWIFGKWLKWLNLFRKVDKVEVNVPRTPELWALNDAVPWKVPYLKMFEVSKYEIDMIWDKSRNLQAILKDFDPKDRFIVESLNKKANLWIEARLWNINNMLDYTIAHPGNLKEFNEMVVEGGYKKLFSQFYELEKKWHLNLTEWNNKLNKMVLNKVKQLESKNKN